MSALNHTRDVRRRHLPLLLIGAVAVLLAAPLAAQERSEPPPDSIPIPVTRTDSATTDSLRGIPPRGMPPRRQPTLKEVVEEVLAPPPDTRQPWPWGPKDKYKTIGALTGGGVGLVSSQFNDKNALLSTLAGGVMGYMAGMFVDLVVDIRTAGR